MQPFPPHIKDPNLTIAIVGLEEEVSLVSQDPKLEISDTTIANLIEQGACPEGLRTDWEAACRENESNPPLLESVRNFNARDMIAYTLMNTDERTKDILTHLPPEGYYDGENVLEFHIKPCEIARLAGIRSLFIAALSDTCKKYHLQSYNEHWMETHPNLSVWNAQGNLMDKAHPEHVKFCAALSEKLCSKVAAFPDPYHDKGYFNEVTVGHSRGNDIRLAGEGNEARIEIRLRDPISAEEIHELFHDAIAHATSAIADPKAKKTTVIPCVQGHFYSDARDSEGQKLLVHLLNSCKIGPDGWLVPEPEYIQARLFQFKEALHINPQPNGLKEARASGIIGAAAEWMQDAIMGILSCTRVAFDHKTQSYQIEWPEIVCHKDRNREVLLHKPGIKSDDQCKFVETDKSSHPAKVRIDVHKDYGAKESAANRNKHFLEWLDKQKNGDPSAEKTLYQYYPDKMKKLQEGGLEAALHEEILERKYPTPDEALAHIHISGVSPTFNFSRKLCAAQWHHFIDKQGQYNVACIPDTAIINSNLRLKSFIRTLFDGPLLRDRYFNDSTLPYEAEDSTINPVFTYGEDTYSYSAYKSRFIPSTGPEGIFIKDPRPWADPTEVKYQPNTELTVQGSLAHYLAESERVPCWQSPVELPFPAKAAQLSTTKLARVSPPWQHTIEKGQYVLSGHLTQETSPLITGILKSNHIPYELTGNMLYIRGKAAIETITKGLIIQPDTELKIIPELLPIVKSPPTVSKQSPHIR